MVINRRKIIKRINDAFVMQKKDKNKRYVIMKSQLITSEEIRNENLGLYIQKELLIEIIKGIKEDNIRLIYASTPNTISLDFSLF